MFDELDIDGKEGGSLRIKHNYYSDDTTSGDNVGPVVYDDIAGSDFKWYKHCLEDEEVPASCYTEGIVHVAPSETNEW
jgi:hypothetical protein